MGTERLPESGYFRAKIAQEQLIEKSAIPYSIVHATQFFEFVESIADAATDGSTVRLAPFCSSPSRPTMSPARSAESRWARPLNGTVEVAGPRSSGSTSSSAAGCARHDPREVVTDPHARYFGARLGERTLLPGDQAQVGETDLDAWLSQSTNGR